MTTILFFKAYVGPYLRGGKIVNAMGYRGRNARAVASPGQMSLFGAGEPQHTEPTRELIEEHERLVDVLNSPSHEDDKVEAKKQAEELAEMKREVSSSGVDRSKPDLGLTDTQKDEVRRAGASWAKYSQHRLNGIGHQEAIDRSAGTGAKKQASELAEMKQEDAQALKDKLQMLHDFLKEKPDSPNASAWKAKIAEIEAKVGPLKSESPAAGKKPTVDTSGWSQPAQAAFALKQEYEAIDKLNNKAVGAFKIKLRALAKKTPEDDQKATLLLDGLATKVWGTDYDPKVAGLEFASADKAPDRKKSVQDAISYLGGRAAKQGDVLELASFIDGYGYSNSLPDDVYIPIKNAAAAINHITRTSRISTEHGLAARKLTGAKARKVLADVAAAGGLGSIQDHIDAFQRIMGGSTMTKSIVFLRRPS